jgi:hypothetical protein
MARASNDARASARDILERTLAGRPAITKAVTSAPAKNAIAPETILSAIEACSRWPPGPAAREYSEWRRKAPQDESVHWPSRPTGWPRVERRCGGAARPIGCIRARPSAPQVLSSSVPRARTDIIDWLVRPAIPHAGLWLELPTIGRGGAQVPFMKRSIPDAGRNPARRMTRPSPLMTRTAGIVST